MIEKQGLTADMPVVTKTTVNKKRNLLHETTLDTIHKIIPKRTGTDSTTTEWNERINERGNDKRHRCT